MWASLLNLLATSAMLFGVQLARAARFGLPDEPKKPAAEAAKAAPKTAPAKGKPALSEEDKAKLAARAARFGVPTAERYVHKQSTRTPPAN